MRCCRSPSIRNMSFLKTAQRYWLVLAILAAKAEGTSIPNRQPSVTSPGVQEQHFPARTVRPHQQVTPGGGSFATGAQADLNEGLRHTLIRREAQASAAFDATGSQHGQNPGGYGPAPATGYGPPPRSGQQSSNRQQVAYSSEYGSQQAAGYASPNPTPFVALENGACIVPVWTRGKTDYLCKEGATSKLELEIEGNEEKLIKDGGTCTVVCPRWWMEPSWLPSLSESTPTSMKCKKNDWSPSGDVKCATSRMVYAGLFILVLCGIASYYYRQQQLKHQPDMIQHAHAQPAPHTAPAAHPEQQPPQ